MTSSPIRVLCVEDNELVADAIGRKLSKDLRFQWLGWVSTKSELLDKARESTPDVVCMDLDIPGQDTIEMIRDLKAVAPSSRVLVLTGHVREDYVNKTVDAGAWGYLSKAEESRVIIESIRRIAAGEFVLGRLTLAECDGPVVRPIGDFRAARPA
jgi:two-component system, NarL family, invasion response regulator UvrY